jgi:serine/threonine protein kinase
MGCPQGHELKVAPESAAKVRFCDYCKQVPISRLCRPCNFDVCSKCENKVAKRCQTMKASCGQCKMAKEAHPAKHESIVGLRHAFEAEYESGTAICVVMDMVQGQTLQDALKTQNELVPISLVMAWFLRILDALAFIHFRGLVHRDLKPANIIVGEKGKITIVDFGVSVAVNQRRAEVGQVKIHSNPL